MGFLKKSAFFQDIDTISDFLGEKKYLMGEEVRDNKQKYWIEVLIEMRERKFESSWAQKLLFYFLPSMILLL